MKISFRDIYWTESGMLKATSLQGQNARNVASLEDSYNWVNGLSFDSVNRQIYIGASGQNTSLGTIFKCRITEGKALNSVDYCKVVCWLLFVIQA